MIHLNIKPLSVNESYRGRKYCTPALTKYKLDLSRMIPLMKIPDGPIAVIYLFGVSSKSADGDNLIKSFQDALCERYGINDRRIYDWRVRKVDVPKGKEFVKFEISTFNPLDKIPTGSYNK